MAGARRTPACTTSRSPRRRGPGCWRSTKSRSADDASAPGQEMRVLALAPACTHLDRVELGIDDPILVDAEPLVQAFFDETRPTAPCAPPTDHSDAARKDLRRLESA